MRLGEDDFIYVLVAAVLILVAFGIFSIFVSVPGTGGPGTEAALASFTVGTVGFAQDFPAKTLTLGTFTVGESQFETLKSALQLEVSNGLAGERTESLPVTVPASFESTLRNVRISFSVFDTNTYGNLLVKWNGVTVFSGKPKPGPISLTLDQEAVKNANTLEFSAEGPGLIFWASTVYVLKNVKVELDYGPEKLFPFELFSSELGSLDRAELSFFGSGSGTLTVKINGKPVFAAVPKGAEAVSFGLDVPLKAGTNILAFSSTGVNVVGGGVLSVFLLTSELSKAKVFDVSPDQLQQVKEGKAEARLVFNVKQAIKSGVLTVTLNGKEFQLPAVAAGNNTVLFGPSDLIAGQNTLIFSGTGNWEIGDASVVLAKK